MAQRPDPARSCAHAETFIKERKHADTGKVEKVDIDDACMFLAVFENGSIGTFESTRYARGRKNYSTMEINGENGALFFDLEDPHILQFFRYADPEYGQEDRRPPDRLAADPRDQLRAPLHEELVGARLHDRLRAHVHQQLRRLPGQPGEGGEPFQPDMKAALRTQKVCDAVLQSAKAGRWVTL